MFSRAGTELWGHLDALFHHGCSLAPGLGQDREAREGRQTCVPVLGRTLEWLQSPMARDGLAQMAQLPCWGGRGSSCPLRGQYTC